MLTATVGEPAWWPYAAWDDARARGGRQPVPARRGRVAQRRRDGTRSPRPRCAVGADRRPRPSRGRGPVPWLFAETGKPAPGYAQPVAEQHAPGRAGAALRAPQLGLAVNSLNVAVTSRCRAESIIGASVPLAGGGTGRHGTLDLVQRPPDPASGRLLTTTRPADHAAAHLPAARSAHPARRPRRSPPDSWWPPTAEATRPSASTRRRFRGQVLALEPWAVRPEVRAGQLHGPPTSAR